LIKSQQMPKMAKPKPLLLGRIPGRHHPQRASRVSSQLVIGTHPAGSSGAP
jgi:hypothetical protein